MKPVLYAPDEKKFDTNGLGTLTDALECTVTEERNGEYFLSLIYPAEGKHFEKIGENCFVVATVADGSRQRFIVKSLLTTINGHCQIYAEHFSYLLNGIPVKPCAANNPADALIQAKKNSVVNNPFTFETTLKSSVKWEIKAPRSFRNLLGGEQGSLLDKYGGEYEWDNDRVILHDSRGAEQPIVISYGKDITDLTDDIDGTSAITGIYPYYQGENDVVVGDIVKAPIQVPFERIATEEISQYMNIEGEAVPTKAQVTAAGRIALANRLISATENLKVSFVPLWQAEEYKTTLQNLKLCDTITVRYDKLGILRKTKVVKTVWDVLLDRYESIELGDIKTGLVGSIIDIKGSVVEVKETLKQEIQDTATQLEGYVDDTAEEIYDEMHSENADIRQEFRAKDGVLESTITQNKSEADRKFSSIYQDIDTIEFTVSSHDSRLGTAESKISQNASNINLKVSKNNIISEINASPERITIDSSRLDITAVTTIKDPNGSAYVQINGNSLNFYPGGSYISWNNGVLNFSSTGRMDFTASKFNFSGDVPWG